LLHPFPSAVATREEIQRIQPARSGSSTPRKNIKSAVQKSSAVSTRGVPKWKAKRAKRKPDSSLSPSNLGVRACGNALFPVHCISCDPRAPFSLHLIPSSSPWLNLLPNRHTTRLIPTTLRPRSNPRHLLRILLIHTRSPLQQALLDRTARLPVRNSRGQSSTTGTTSGGNAAPAVLAIGSARVGNLLREVRDGVWGGVGVAEAADQGVVGFAGFGEGVVA
jgi:hypothetical protein